ncbi:MAG: acylneuraminate cytidylyltransferase [Candidatus Aureabacteria bacterium]|nr:acylneuraminate cytidylyltransferase [Candidatus Auribacterota bacterium]
MKISAIIQTRTGSTRLPGKALKKICGKTVIELIIERIKKINADDIIAAIPSIENDEFCDILQSSGVEVFKGSEEDVLSRFHGASLKYSSDIIIRVNGDNLLIHPYFVDKATETLISTSADYVNVVDAPVGCGVDVFTFKALDKAFNLKDLTEIEKEHVIPVFFRKGLFKIESFFVKGKLAKKDLRLTLDTSQDFSLLEKIYENVYNPGTIISLEDAIDLIEKDPEILNLNKDIKQKGWK